MQKSSTLFLKFVLCLIALISVVILFWFPQTEGRAAHLSLLTIYADPFIIYGYLASIPFFIALFQAFKLLDFIEKNNVFSSVAVRALRNIKYCAITISGSIVLAVLFVRLTVHGDDDPAGFVALGTLAIFGSVVIATAAAVFERLLQKAVDLKSENDLTV